MVYSDTLHVHLEIIRHVQCKNKKINLIHWFRNIQYNQGETSLPEIITNKNTASKNNNCISVRNELHNTPSPHSTLPFNYFRTVSKNVYIIYKKLWRSFSLAMSNSMGSTASQGTAAEDQVWHRTALDSGGDEHSNYSFLFQNRRLCKLLCCRFVSIDKQTNASSDMDSPPVLRLIKCVPTDSSTNNYWTSS